MDADDAHRVRRIAHDCLAVRMRLLNRVVSGWYDQALRPHGLKASQMNLLVAIAARQPVQPAALGRLLAVEKSTLSRNLDRLEARGWILVVTLEDGRSQQLTITQEGLALLREVESSWEEAQERALDALGPDAIDSLRTMSRQATAH